jgi:hypothetical protein
MALKLVRLFPENNIFKPIFFAAIILAMVFSCTKKPETIGLDLVDDEKFQVFDTVFPVVAYSAIDDSVETDGTSVNLVGSQFTETFGRTNASFYSHIRLVNVNPDFGQDTIADSIILSLVYSGYYGNISTSQTVKVYRVVEDFFINSTYYYDTIIGIDSIPIGELTFVPNPTDSVMVDTTLYPAELRIPLNEKFADIIFNTDPANLSSNENFINYFRGIYVEADKVNAAGEGAILSFDLLNERSNVTIYYRDSLQFVFSINANSARIGKFEHNYSLSSDQTFKEQIINNDTTFGSEALYVQGLAGIKTIVKFPDIINWTYDNGFAINEARLIIPAQPDASEYDPPESLILLRQTQNGSIAIMDDFTIGDNYFGGTYDSTNANYEFRISLHIQSLLNGDPDYGLVIFPISKVVRANGVKLAGYDPSLEQSMELRIIYTDIRPNN